MAGEIRVTRLCYQERIFAKRRKVNPSVGPRSRPPRRPPVLQTAKEVLAVQLTGPGRGVGVSGVHCRDPIPKCFSIIAIAVDHEIVRVADDLMVGPAGRRWFSRVQCGPSAFGLVMVIKNGQREVAERWCQDCACSRNSRVCPRCLPDTCDYRRQSDSLPPDLAIALTKAYERATSHAGYDFTAHPNSGPQPRPQANFPEKIEEPVGGHRLDQSTHA